MNSLHKKNFKIELYILKVLPSIIALFYLIFTVCTILHININFIAYFFHLSVISWIFLLYTSFLFKFCVHHRIPLYYILLNDVINILNSASCITMEVYTFLKLHSVILGVCLFVYIYTYLKYKKYEKFNKNFITANSRKNR
jgi:hypothetical protein